MTQPNNQNAQKANDADQNATSLDTEAKDQKSTATTNESTASQQTDSSENWKDGKPFNPEWAAKKIDELNQELKVLKPKAKKADEYEAEQKKRAEAELTEAQRLQKQNEELANQNAKLQADIWRNEAATAANLPSIFAGRIQGKTKEEMLLDAKKLAEALPQATKTPPKINATNPANANQNETEAQQRERLFGRQGKVFDLNAIREAGGGVIWNTDPNKEK